jgi:hypothetical protein
MEAERDYSRRILMREKGGQSSLFEQERQRRLRIPVDARQELRMNVLLQRRGLR